MSLIGPRPLLVQYLPLYSEKQRHENIKREIEEYLEKYPPALELFEKLIQGKIWGKMNYGYRGKKFCNTRN